MSIVNAWIFWIVFNIHVLAKTVIIHMYNFFISLISSKTKYVIHEICTRLIERYLTIENSTEHRENGFRDVLYSKYSSRTYQRHCKPYVFASLFWKYLVFVGNTGELFPWNDNFWFIPHVQNSLGLSSLQKSKTSLPLSSSPANMHLIWW